MAADESFAKWAEPNMKAVIQCGGKGTRLMPYTMVLPKPLMPVGSLPVLELVLQWLRRNDVTEVFITTGYLGNLIRTSCGDGRRWGLSIKYTEEAQPLGTIGPLRMLRKALDSTFLVVNGDVLTNLSISAMTAFHRRMGNLVSVATVNRSIAIDFGVLEQVDGRVTQFKEKPNLSHLVSMGVYLMQPEVFEHIPPRVPFGFDDLILCLLERKAPVGAFRHEGLWLDIGRVDDFRRAQELPWDDQPPAFRTMAAE